MQFPMVLAEGLWVVGNSYFNLYLVKGAQAAALIEVGVSAVADDAAWQIESIGIRPSFLVVTHPHADHLTGLEGLKEAFPEALVVAGEGAAEFLAHPTTAEAMVTEDLHMSRFLASEGMEPGRPPLEEPPSLSDCLVAREGDEMDLGGVTLRFIEAKGHSPGCINVYVPELSALMVSDSLGFRFERLGFAPIFFTGYNDYIETIDKLESFRPHILGLAHQGPLTGPDAAQGFRDARDAAERMRRRILESDRSDEEIVREILEESYRDEYLLYTRENIELCCKLLVKRARQSAVDQSGK